MSGLFESDPSAGKLKVHLFEAGGSFFPLKSSCSKKCLEIFDKALHPTLCQVTEVGMQ